MRVLFLFGDPHDDILYLPEYGAYKRMVTRYSGKGPFLNAPKPEPPNQAGDKIWNILFFENGSTCIMTKTRVVWQKEGKRYATINEISVFGSAPPNGTTPRVFTGRTKGLQGRNCWVSCWPDSLLQDAHKVTHKPVTTSCMGAVA